MKKKLILVLILMAVILSPVLALSKIDPTMEWWIQPGNESDTNIKDLSCAQDSSLSCYARSGSSYNIAMIKLTFPGGSNITEMRYYEKDHADSHYLQKSTTWYYNASEIVSGGYGTTYNAWGNVSINSGNGYVTSAPLYYRGGSWWLQTAELEFWGNPAPVTTEDIDFSGYPLDGYAPLTVNFTVTNFTGVNLSGVTWNFGDGTIETSTSPIKLHAYLNPGIYTVRMSFYNHSDSYGEKVKTDYILVSNQSGMIVNLDVKNGITGALIQDSTVGIKNTSTDVWRNTTAPTGLVYFSTTDPGYLYPLSQGQSITLAANKTGYKDASETFAIPYNNYRARLFLMPDSITNTTGAGTVVVNAIRNKDGLTISGVSVVMDTGQVGLTNTAGATTLFNVTAGNRVVKLSDTDGGYMSTEKSFNLTAGETKLVVVEMVRVGETPVETPVSPTATPRGTYDPDDPNSPVYGNYTTSEINEQGGAGVLGMLAQLIQLWPLAIVMLLLKALRSAMT